MKLWLAQHGLASHWLGHGRWRSRRNIILGPSPAQFPSSGLGPNPRVEAYRLLGYRRAARALPSRVLRQRFERLMPFSRGAKAGLGIRKLAAVRKPGMAAMPRASIGPGPFWPPEVAQPGLGRCRIQGWIFLADCIAGPTASGGRHGDVSLGRPQFDASPGGAMSWSISCARSQPGFARRLLSYCAKIKATS